MVYPPNLRITFSKRNHHRQMFWEYIIEAPKNVCLHLSGTHLKCHPSPCFLDVVSKLSQCCKIYLITYFCTHHSVSLYLMSYHVIRTTDMDMYNCVPFNFHTASYRIHLHLIIITALTIATIINHYI